MKRKMNESVFQEGVCPLCGGQYDIGETHEAEWCYGTREWMCPHCGATGEEGWKVVFDGKQYDVHDKDGNPVDLKDDLPSFSGMRYEHRCTLGLSLYSGLEPYQKVVNNGSIIETQDVSLIRQLIENEKDRSAPAVDWFLFRPAGTVLLDRGGREFACTMNNDGKWIRLTRILGPIKVPEENQSPAVKMARKIVDTFEDLLESHHIIVPDDDRPDNNDTPLYGCTYSDLVDDISETILGTLTDAFEQFNDQLIDIINEREGTQDDNEHAEKLDDMYARLSHKTESLRTVLDLLNNGGRL